MWTSRNLVALGLFLFGTAYLWLAAGRAPAPSGTACTLTNVLAYVAVIGSAVAACGVFKQYSWWETAAVVSGVAGLVAVVSFVAGQSRFDDGFADFGGGSTCGCTSWAARPYLGSCSCPSLTMGSHGAYDATCALAWPPPAPGR